MMTCYDDAMRTIIEIPGDQVESLDALCAREDISRAEAIRRAVAAYLRRESPSASSAFGLWRGKRGTGLAYEEARRKEWDRPAAKRR
jgi:predicted transcriptional regulator